MQDNNYLLEVRSQYEELPYPERNPLDELKRIEMTFYDGIDRINHICHSGHAGLRIRLLTDPPFGVIEIIDVTSFMDKKMRSSQLKSVDRRMEWRDLNHQISRLLSTHY